VGGFRGPPGLGGLLAWPTIGVVAACGCSSCVGGSCGLSSQNPTNVQCVPLGNCQKEVKVHLKSLNIRDGSLKTESQLLLARAGIV